MTEDSSKSNMTKDHSRAEENDEAVNDNEQFLDSGSGNGLWFSVKCFNNGSQTVDAKCKSNPLKCGHPHIKIGQERIGKFVTINWSTVHTSAYPEDAIAVVAQFFFALSSSNPTRPKRQRIEHRTAFTEGEFDPILCASVGKRAVRNWNGAFACRDIRANGIRNYQGKQLSETKVWPKKAIESELEDEFNELYQLKQIAEARFGEAYGCTVDTHTIWIIRKRGASDQASKDGGGFEPHIDQFAPSLGHIGTISTPIAFLRRQG